MRAPQLSRIANGLVRRVHRLLVDKPFDWLYAIDTNCEGYRPPPGGRVWTPGSYEYASSPALGLWYSLVSLGIDARKFIFVDLGSGKGRGMLIASALPFRRVEGVEISSELHRTGLDNIRSYRGPKRAPIVSRQIDVRAYSIPPDPCVIYMYNPFGDDILRLVLQNVLDSWGKSPRPIYVVYMNPTNSHVFDEGRMWERMPCSRWQRAVSALLSPHEVEVYRLSARRAAPARAAKAISLKELWMVLGQLILAM